MHAASGDVGVVGAGPAVGLAEWVGLVRVDAGSMTTPEVSDDVSALGDAVAVTDGVGVTDGVRVGVGVTEGVGVTVGEGVAEADGDGVGDGVADAVGLGDGDGVGDGDGLPGETTRAQVVCSATMAAAAAASFWAASRCADWTARDVEPDPLPELPELLPGEVDPDELEVLDEPVDVELVDAVLVDAVLVVASVSAVSSVASVAFAAASVAFASMSALVRAAVSSVASVWPAVTASPTPTGAVRTIADDFGDTLAWLEASTVPVNESTCSTDPFVTGTVR